MAGANYFADGSTRFHWGGDESNIDQHLEIYEGTVDTQFEYTQIFKSLSTQKSVAERSNQIRIDRLGASQALYRQSGEDILDQRVKSDKLNVVVEAMLYIRNPVDKMDEWTAPSFWTEMGRNNGTTFGLEYDQAHIIRLQKAPAWVAPAHLKEHGEFHDGFFVPVTLKGGDNLTDAELEQNASALVKAHAKARDTLAKRRVPLSDMVTLVDVDIFSALLHHPKLINKDYTADNGDFANRRVVNVNGIPVVENTAFPTAAITGHGLSTTENGNAFDVTADEIKGRMIIFSKALSLVTVTAQEWTVEPWYDPRSKSKILDCYSMFTVDVRRPDTVGVVRITEQVTP
ncbi:capsid and scaffold protein [Acinetobacter phage vB_AbaP_B1]|uniref:Capsid protein n=2 Tax=Friunavirus TaxID=1985711 RepID=A0A221SBL6_9CAUD|nr:capsid and scaffold protein [Acinetobacter phage vB_AbaP_B1]YP_009610371.1 capsid protein [Acinetobacter phage vB_AbaP_B3]ASN73345.1 capsid and scaffold protein [Acinetobacter phage vB_AbaP_B1]ASN73393.1 capsid protein [Acinetobacter phage vB_AbaP_B3]